MLSSFIVYPLGHSWRTSLWDFGKSSLAPVVLDHKGLLLVSVLESSLINKVAVLIDMGVVIPYLYRVPTAAKTMPNRLAAHHLPALWYRLGLRILVLCIVDATLRWYSVILSELLPRAESERASSARLCNLFLAACHRPRESWQSHRLLHLAYGLQFAFSFANSGTASQDSLHSLCIFSLHIGLSLQHPQDRVSACQTRRRSG